MATYSKHLLSESVDGMSIPIVATGTPGTSIHTAVTGTTDLDEIWLYVNNVTVSGVKLTIEYGDTTDPSDLIEQTIPGEAGLFCVIPGLLLQNGNVVSAFASVANAVNVHGYVNRITG